MGKELIIVLDFGGQYKQLIARRVRECHVYCEICSYKTPLDKLLAMNPKGIILTGGPNSVYAEDSPSYAKELFEAGIPILGICYGSQLMAYKCGGVVKTAPVSEYGHTDLYIDAAGITGESAADTDTAAAGIASELAGNANTAGLVSDVIASAAPAPATPGSPSNSYVSRLFADVHSRTTCWMSHTDYIAKAPEGFRVTAHTANCPIAAMEDPGKNLYAVQFHPEVVHTPEGTKMLRNFVIDICGCAGDWKMDSFVETTVRDLREKIGDNRVLLGLSGGVDSAVAAALLSRAIGRNLYCVFVDHGLMRKNEGDEVEAVFGPKGKFDLNFIRVNAGERYFAALRGVTDPETKRKIIGDLFVDVFGEQAKKLHDQGGVGYLAQGTIYPDVVESGEDSEGSKESGSAVIKSHHNVGGLPREKVIEFGFDEKPVEPLRNLFKDEVRQAGRELGLPEEIVMRQPFPGPGLGIRVVGEVTPEKVTIVQEADAIYREELEKNGVDMSKGQFFAALSNMRSVGVMGDGRTYDYAVVLRGVITSDFMTAEAAQVPWNVLQICMNRIINEVRGVNRVLYDLTSKPPGTIELE